MLCVLVGGCEERTRVEKARGTGNPGAPGAPGDGGKARIRASFTALSRFSGRSLIALDRAGYIPLTWVGR